MDIGDTDIREMVRNGDEIKIDFHLDLVSKQHGHMAIFGICLHILKGIYKHNPLPRHEIQKELTTSID